jgi:integrase
MYEFLDMNLTYDTLDEFQKFKANWLEEADYYSYNSKVGYWRILNAKVHNTEVIKGKDLFDFDKQEIIQLVKYLPTKSVTTKQQLYTAISKYMEWASLKGYNYVGNPCDTITPTELFTINEMAFKEQYIEISDFINFICDLECSDVDRAMLTLLRYGVKIDEVGKVKWDDISADGKFLRIRRDDRDLELPIDGIFMMMMDKAKNCHYRDLYKKKATMKEETNVKIVSYRNSEYIIKPLESVEWDYMDGSTAYNRIGVISKANKIQRISVPDLNSSRKYDLLFDIVDRKNHITKRDIQHVISIFDKTTESKAVRLKNNFELLSGYPVDGLISEKGKGKRYIKKGRKNIEDK